MMSNNSSVISWRSVLLVEYPGKTIELLQVTVKLYYINNVVSSTPRRERDLNSQFLVVLGIDCTGSYKSN